MDPAARTEFERLSRIYKTGEPKLAFPEKCLEIINNNSEMKEKIKDDKYVLMRI